MPYFVLLLPILFGLLTGKVWEGAILGIVLWWLVRQSLATKTATDPEVMQQLANMQNELAALQAKVQYLEQHITYTPDAPSIELPSITVHQTTSVPVETELSTLSTQISHSQPIEPIVPSAVSATAPLMQERKTMSIRKRLQQTGKQDSDAMAISETMVSQTRTETEPMLLPSSDLTPSWWTRLMGGNVLLKTGMVVLFLGLAFLLRLAAERIEVSIEARYVMVAVAGVVAAVTGWRVQEKRREYGLMLQGFGIAVLYLTALAALRLHPLLPASVTFMAMVALVGVMATLAVRQNALALAQVALVGGMAAPILASDGSGRYLVLFGYLALLNTGVASIAWFKAWRSLNVVGFVGTFTIGAAWGVHAYTPAHFATTEPFLLYHWLLYTGIACLFARQKLLEGQTNGQEGGIPDDASLAQIWRSVCDYGVRVGVLDSALLFGTALAAFGLQYQMVASWEYAAAGSALGFALVYAGWAMWISRWQAQWLVLRQAFVGLAALFVTLAIPLALEQQWTASAWALQAALVYGFALRQKLPVSRLLAWVVFVLAALVQLGVYRAAGDTILAGSLLGTAMVAGSGAAMYTLWWRYRCVGSAVWEMHAQSVVLAAAVVFISCLPLLVWAERGSMLAWAILAAVWAHGQRWHTHQVLSGAAGVLGVGVLWWGLYVYWEGAGYGSLHTAAWLLGSALGLGAAAWALHQRNTRLNEVAGWLLLAMTVLLGVMGVKWGLEGVVRYDKLWAWLVVFALLTAVANGLRWQQGQRMTWVFLPVWAAGFMLQEMVDTPMASATALLATTALQAYVLVRSQGQQQVYWVYHFVSLLLLGMMWTTWAGNVGERYFTGVWAQLAWWWVPMLLAWGLQQGRTRFTGTLYQVAYWQWGSAVAMAYSAAWLLYANVVTPWLPQPLPYVPVLNPLELAMLWTLWQGFCWLKAWLPTEDGAETQAVYRGAMVLPLGLAFFTLSAAVMRAWHFFDGVAWDLARLLASFGLQASLSLVWASVAIVLMVTGNQNQQRNRWLMGATLMGVVVVKLFVVELGNSGGVARIVSFIGVGLLLLLVGWFAPVPPKLERENNNE